MSCTLKTPCDSDNCTQCLRAVLNKTLTTLAIAEKNCQVKDRDYTHLFKLVQSYREYGSELEGLAQKVHIAFASQGMSQIMKESEAFKGAMAKLINFLDRDAPWDEE